jgi:flagellar biosynthesis component FlhA
MRTIATLVNGSFQIQSERSARCRNLTSVIIIVLPRQFIDLLITVNLLFVVIIYYNHCIAINYPVMHFVLYRHFV